MTAGRSSRRKWLGCWLNERWRAEVALRAPWTGTSWLDLHNRDESIVADTLTRGRICSWVESTQLTLNTVFPHVGSRVMARALEEWPISFASTLSQELVRLPEVSFVIPIGGGDRLGPFDLALAAARAQRNVQSEVVVVEQSPMPTLQSRLPADVRYVHRRVPTALSGFNKSAALNAGASEARAPNLIVLDGDYIVPADFARQCVDKLKYCEAVRPARLIFYLDEATTRAVGRSSRLGPDARLESIVANNPTPIALRAATYWEIGGHDENYEGWGGEDCEFLERLRTRRIAEGGWMPVVHAWHAPAVQKLSGHRNRELHSRVTAVEVEERITQLVQARQSWSPQLRTAVNSRSAIES